MNNLIWLPPFSPINRSLHEVKATSKGGVLLIEILMVIAIIAILMGLMFPVFAKAIRKARSLGHENPKNPNGPRIAPSSVRPKEWEKD